MKKYSDFAIKTCNKFKKNQEKFAKTYDLKSYSEWFYDHETSIITFKNNKKEIKAHLKFVGRILSLREKH